MTRDQKEERALPQPFSLDQPAYQGEWASILMRGKGLGGVGVRELMSTARLAPGALSKQFATKEALAAEACAFAFAGAEEAFIAAARGDENGRERRLAG